MKKERSGSSNSIASSPGGGVSVSASGGLAPSKCSLQVLVNEKLDYIQDIIRNTILSIQYYKKLEIFSSSDCVLSVSLLNELFDKTVDLLNKNNAIKDGDIAGGYTIDNVINDLQKIIDKLATIFINFGTKNLEDLIFICFGNEYKNMKYSDPILQDKYNLLKKYVHPINYKMVPWKASGVQPKKHISVYGVGVDTVNCYCEDKNTDEIVCYEASYHLECYDADTTTMKSFHQKINGIRLILQNEKTHKSLIINCIVEPIGIELLHGAYVRSRKNSILSGIPENFADDKTIVERIIDTMVLKDVLVSGNNDVYKKIYSIYCEVNSIKQNKLDIVIKKFLETPISAQRNTLINLLIYNKEENIQYITYLLYNLINLNVDQSATNSDSDEQKIIYESFPWRIKMYFKDTMKLAIKFTQDMLSKYDINKISLEQQIFLLKASENVKEKAMIKLKEIKGKGDEQGIKAKQYLEGLIKIPFGIYKKEPILCINGINNDLYLKLLSKCASENSEILSDISKKDKYTCVEISGGVDKIEKNGKTGFMEDLINGLETCSLKQLNSCISYIKTCNFIDIDKFGVIGQNKSEKCEWLKSICSHYFSINNMCFYKMFDIISADADNNCRKLHADIKEIRNNISNMHKSLADVGDVLEASIYGHTHAKNQIMKIIGQWMTGEQNGNCFGFEGSPGIGKTSLAKKGLSHCLIDEYGKERPFAFIALGGSCNGSTLEGHSYTYVNSTWGRIVDILMESKCMNPIIYIDELDKVSKTEHGKEIIGILTHLIDSTQNDGFQDKYFSGIDIDLSKALFIFSYNDPEAIDKILLDRIHRVRFDNLTTKDKLVIVNKYILPEINKKLGFQDTVVITDEIVEYIIDAYTMEPGVRKLKELLFDLYGEINIKVLKCENISVPVVLSIPEIETSYLKKYRKIEEKNVHSCAKTGIINGLWANSLGKGGIIPIETCFYPSSVFLDLKLTGLQGDVMKESMNVAKSLAWKLTDDSRKPMLLAEVEKTKCQGLHVHCPEGGVAKDGPSAGTAICTAIYSLFNGLKIKNTVAITGEINLQGEVCAIGGLELKILGGIRAGVKTFIYPEENKKDFLEIEKKYSDKFALESIEFIMVKHINDVLSIVFE